MDMTSGDSAALRSHGAQLRAAAEQIRTLTERLERRTEAAEFRGPAADRFRAGMSDRIARLRRVEHDLQDLADVVVQDSGSSGSLS